MRRMLSFSPLGGPASKRNQGKVVHFAFLWRHDSRIAPHTRTPHVPTQMAVCVYPMRAQRSRNSSSAADAAPSSSAIDGAASAASGTRRASSRLAATSPAKAAAARSPESGGEHEKDNTTVAEDRQQQQRPNPQQTQPGPRSAGARKRARTNLYGSEESAGNADAGTAGAPRSSSSEARSDTAGVAASGDDAAKTNGTSSGSGEGKGGSSADQTNVAANDNSGAGNRTSRLSLTKRRAARAQAQAQSHAQVQTKEKSQASAQQPSPGRAKGQKYRVGTVISKDFDGVAYRGEIVSYDAKARYYKARYVEDGDEEELEEAEIERFLDPMDCSSDVGSIATTTAATTSSEDGASGKAKVSTRKPRGRSRGASTAAATSDNNDTDDRETPAKEPKGKSKGAKATASKAKSVDSGNGDKVACVQYPFGTEISKDFVGVAYRGKVVAYNETSRFYMIRYSDGDEEEMDTKDIKLYVVVPSVQKGSEKKGAKKSASSEIDGKAGDDGADVKKSSVSAREDAKSKKRKRSEEEPKPSDPPISSRDEILQAATKLAAAKAPPATTSSAKSNSEKADTEEKETFSHGHVCRDAQFYTSLNDETPLDCSEKLGCECSDLLAANRKRYKFLSAKSKLQEGTILRIPDKRDVEKVLLLYKYEKGEPKLDYCYVCLEIESPDGPEMLLCDGDGCDKACHLPCTHDKLTSVPDGDWYCKSCEGTRVNTSSKPKKEKKKRSKLKRVPKAGRSKSIGTGVSVPSSSSTPNVPSARPVTPASHDVMDSLAFLGASAAPASASAPARGTGKVKTSSNKSRSTGAKSKKKSKQTKSSPRPKTPKDQESVLSSPINLPSKKLFAGLDGQVAENATSDTTGTGAETGTGSKKKKKAGNKKNAALAMDSIALTVEEEFRCFEQTRLKGERQTIALRIRRLKEEITSLQDQGKAAAAKTGGEKPELALSRAKKTTWKELELKNLEGEEKRLTNRLDELSAPVTDNATDSNAAGKKSRPSSKKPSQKKRKKPLGSDDDEGDGKPKVKAKRANKSSAKRASTRKGSSDIQRKREQARRKRKKLKLSRRSSKSSRAGDDDLLSDEDYSQVWVNDNATDSNDHNLPPDMAPDEPPPKKKRRHSRKSGGSARSGKGNTRWLPCGSCLGCVQSKDCGRCRSCLERPEESADRPSSGAFQRYICIQRQCLAPTRKGDGSESADNFNNALPLPSAADTVVASQDKELPQLSGGIKRKDMPALGGIKPNPSPPIPSEAPIADGMPKRRHDEDIDEIESLSDGGDGIFMSDLDEVDDDDDALGLNPGVGISNAEDNYPPPLHQATLPPVPQQVTVPSPVRGKKPGAGAISARPTGGNAAAMARDLRRRDRSNYDDDDADDWSSVGGSLGSQDEAEMMALPPL